MFDLLYLSGITLLVDELSAPGTTQRASQHHVTQAHVPRIVRVVGHTTTDAHQQHVLHLWG